jgi:hypothetical protein
VEFLGLAGVPRRAADALEAAATAMAEMAAELTALSRGAGQLDRLAQTHAATRRAVHDAYVEAAQMLGGGVDREDVLAIATSLRAVADRLAETAPAIERADADAAPWESLAGVQRDLSRELAGAVAGLDGGRRHIDARLDRADSLLAEGSRLLRLARARLLIDQDDVTIALPALDALRRAERALVASKSCARAIRRVVIKHR